MNMKEQRIKEKLEKEQIVYDEDKHIIHIQFVSNQPHLTMRICEAELEDGTCRKAYKFNFGKCSLDDAMWIIDAYNNFVEDNEDLVDGGIMDLQKNNDYVESFEYVFVNIKDIDEDTFGKMLFFLVRTTLIIMTNIDQIFKEMC